MKEIEYLIHNYNTKKNNEITILARNKTYENLKNNGLIIKHKLKGKTVDHFNAILPLVFACYKVNGNLKLLKNDKEYY